MALTILKYPLNIQDSITLKMSKKASILSLQMQDSIPCIWALIDPEEELENRNFKCYRTGDDLILKSQRYVGTLQFYPCVWHLFEVI